MKSIPLDLHPFRSSLNQFDSGSLILPALSTKVKISWNQSYYCKQVVIMFQGSTKGVLRRPSQDHILFVQYRGTQNNPLIIILIKYFKTASIHANIHHNTEVNNIWRKEEWNQRLKQNLQIQKIPEQWSKIIEFEQKLIPKIKKQIFDMILDEQENENSSQVYQQNFATKIDTNYQLQIKQELNKLKYTDQHHQSQRIRSNRSKKIKKTKNKMNKQVKAFKRQKVMTQRVIKAPFGKYDEGATYFPALKNQIKISWTNEQQIKEVKVAINDKIIMMKPVLGFIMYIYFFGSSEQPMGMIGFKSKTGNKMYRNVIEKFSKQWSQEFTNSIRNNIEQDEIPQDW